MGDITIQDVVVDIDVGVISGRLDIDHQGVAFRQFRIACFCLDRCALPRLPIPYPIRRKHIDRRAFVLAHLLNVEVQGLHAGGGT